eukprot:Pgem_evm1s2011
MKIPVMNPIECRKYTEQPTAKNEMGCPMGYPVFGICGEKIFWETAADFQNFKQNFLDKKQILKPQLITEIHKKVENIVRKNNNLAKLTFNDIVNSDTSSNYSFLVQDLGNLDLQIEPEYKLAKYCDEMNFFSVTKQYCVGNYYNTIDVHPVRGGIYSSLING